MAREINAELLDTKIEKAQQDLVKARERFSNRCGIYVERRQD